MHRTAAGNIQAATLTTGVVDARRATRCSTATSGRAPASCSSISRRCRIDYNLSDNHRLSGIDATIWVERDPDYLNSGDVRFPGAPNYRSSTRSARCTRCTLRSTLLANIVNELRAGITAFGGASYFGEPRATAPQTFADQDGYAIDFDADIGLTNWHVRNRAELAQRADATNIDEHADLAAGLAQPQLRRRPGCARRRGRTRRTDGAGINLGFNTTQRSGDRLFTTTNFPGASGGAAHRRARTLRAADRTGHRRHWSGGAGSGHQQVRRARAAYARGHASTCSRGSCRTRGA